MTQSNNTRQSDPLDDYEIEKDIKTSDNQPSIPTKIAKAILYNDYDVEESTQVSKINETKKAIVTPKTTHIPSGTQNKKKLPHLKDSNSTDQNQQPNERMSENQRPPKRNDIRDNFGGARIFNRAFSAVFTNSQYKQKQVEPALKPVNHPKEDEFAKWMCSWSINQSLWTSDMYKTALLKYIGRIYKQEAYIQQYFAKLKSDLTKFDELDLLNELILKTKERHDAQKFLDKWKDNSRIERRLKDIKYIFDYMDNSRTLKSMFTVKLNNVEEIIDRKRIRSYFDFGCGDGTITASIGQYLGLNKEYIFGGDVYDEHCDGISFVKLNENQLKINLPNNSIDLVTVFVTFHHISNLQETLLELKRIVRPNGYLILREHDCENKFSFSAKYLNFIHAIMMIAEVGEFANSSNDYCNENHVCDWPKKKSSIIEYAKTIFYRTCEEWECELKHVGFYLRATLHYGVDGSSNPQKLFYAVYQLNK